MKPVRAGLPPQTRVLAEFPVDQAIPDVNGVDALGSPLQEAVGETPGRTTDVKRDQTAWLDGERVEGGRQFFSGPTDKGGGTFDLKACVTGDEPGRFVNDHTVHEHATGENCPYCGLPAADKALLDQQTIQPLFLNGRFRVHGAGDERWDSSRRAPQWNQEEDSSEESFVSSSGEKA